MDLNNYLTNEESEQMERLLKKAAERRQQDKGKSDDAVSLLFMQMQYASRKQPDGGSVERREDFEADLENVTEQLCKFCQKYKLCDSRRKCGEYCEEDQELPFG